MIRNWIYITIVALILALFPSFNTQTVTEEQQVLKQHVPLPIQKPVVEAEVISIEFGNVSKDDFVNFLSKCIDNNPKHHDIKTRIPKDLIVAQAGHESSWGNSRFAKEANNLFGIRTWDPERDQIKPLKVPNSPWGIIKFENSCGSVDFYYELINNHNAYKSFRNSRQIMIRQNQELDSLVLVNFLSMFSELGQEYVDRLTKSIIQIRKEYPWLQQY